MVAMTKFLREKGVFMFAVQNTVHTNPPLCITKV
jgi:adenosylmethionine-8-amino-7-oxononanoate aminotransferase